MNKLTTTVIGVVAAIALIASFTYDQSPKLITGAQGPQGPRGEQGIPGPAGKDGVTTVITKTEAPKLGAVTGPDVYTRMFLNNGETVGGSIVSTTTVASLSSYITLQADFVSAPTVITWNNGVNMTVSLSATSTIPWVPKIGDTATVYFLNASTTAGSAITFAATDANTDLQFAEATGGDLVLNGLDWAKFTIIRQSQYKVSIIFDEFTEAD